MAETFNKREKEKKRLQKRKEKDQRKEDRKANNKDKSFEDMLAYVDENGNISSTPPDLSRKKIIRESDIELSSRNMGGTVAAAHVGLVKFYDAEKGYGFIKEDETNEEYFFHYSSADFPVAQQNRVSFETERGPKGMNAVRITKA
jgi:cold shock CspA family protein